MFIWLIRFVLFPGSYVVEVSSQTVGFLCSQVCIAVTLSMKSKIYSHKFTESSFLQLIFWESDRRKVYHPSAKLLTNCLVVVLGKRTVISFSKVIMHILYLILISYLKSESIMPKLFLNQKTYLIFCRQINEVCLIAIVFFSSAILFSTYFFIQYIFSCTPS
jgi:hypothetical protein